jgi:murein peptide amidase A
LLYGSKSRISHALNSPTNNDPTGQVAPFLNEFAAAATEHGFREEKFGDTEADSLLAFTKHTPGPRPRIYISSGIHGDEPAPPVALLSLIRGGFFDERANWFLCPVINPRGLQIGTREDHQERDLNRDFLDRKTPEIHALTHWLNRQPCFDLCICLHEDWESQGFYLYEVNRSGSSAYASEILEAVKPALPIEPATMIDERPIDEPGIIRPVNDPLLRIDWPETIYLINHHTSLGYTLETPSALPMEKRIHATKLAIDAALKGAIRDFGQTSPYPPSTEL